MSPHRPNRLSDSIEPRYRLTLFLFLTFVPVVIAVIAVGASLAKAGVWIGSEDEVGRTILLGTAAVSLASRFWQWARTSLSFCVIAAFGGRAFGFLIVGGPDLTWPNRIGATMSWAAITIASLLLILQMDTLIRFRDERRDLGLE